jgi:hypothetical protein
VYKRPSRVIDNYSASGFRASGKGETTLDTRNSVESRRVYWRARRVSCPRHHLAGPLASALHRKNAMVYKTKNGARVGDLFMTLIDTCQLNQANPFEYLTPLQRHVDSLANNPQLWMPRNYREALL